MGGRFTQSIIYFEIKLGPSYPRSRGSTLRSTTNPMGCGTGMTGQHNIMVGRVCVLLALAFAKQVWWCLEQPKGSLLENHLLFQSMLKLKHLAVTKVTCSLGWFGADTLKPIWVYSSSFVDTMKGFLFLKTPNALCLLLEVLLVVYD